jgi:hypothetical protein
LLLFGAVYKSDTAIQYQRANSYGNEPNCAEYLKKVSALIGFDARLTEIVYSTAIIHANHPIGFS